MTQTLEKVIEKAVKKLLIDHTNAEHPAYIAKAVREWWRAQNTCLTCKSDVHILLHKSNCEGANADNDKT